MRRLQIRVGTDGGLHTLLYIQAPISPLRRHRLRGSTRRRARDAARPSRRSRYRTLFSLIRWPGMRDKRRRGQARSADQSLDGFTGWSGVRRTPARNRWSRPVWAQGRGLRSPGRRREHRGHVITDRDGDLVAVLEVCDMGVLLFHCGRAGGRVGAQRPWTCLAISLVM